MKLTLQCQVCQHEIRVRNFVNDRSELARSVGENFSKTCPKCKNERSYHVNSVKAQESKFLPLIALCLMIAATAYLGYFFMGGGMGNYYYITGLLLVPSFAYVAVLKQEQKNVNNFNRYHL